MTHISEHERKVRDAHFRDGERGQDFEACRIRKDRKELDERGEHFPARDAALDETLRASVEQ